MAVFHDPNFHDSKLSKVELVNVEIRASGKINVPIRIDVAIKRNGNAIGTLFLSPDEARRVALYIVSRMEFAGPDSDA